MSLCDLCKSIPLENLPPFPDTNVIRTLSGVPYIQCLFLQDKDLESVGFKHQPDLQSLQNAAATGCGICRLIETQVECVLADIDGMSGDMRGVYSRPKFDLWLTKLPNWRSGFLALTNSTNLERTRGDRREIYSVAAISLGAEEDDPLAVRFDCRPIQEVPDHDTFKKVARWVEDCDAHKSDMGNRKTMPIRLIDVSLEDSSSTLHIVNDGKGIERYVALSHCYKNRVIPQANLLFASQESIDLATLPKTFRDAVAVTRELSVKYLWIDEVCIAREDSANWARDSAIMAAVFANAYLTLAATGAKDTSEGLLLRRKTRDYVRVDYTANGNLKAKVLFGILPLDKEMISSYYVQMRSEPLSQDIWAFQDRVLSPRTLHFASDQIYLECQQDFISEDGLCQSNTQPEWGCWFDGIPPNKDEAFTKWYSLLGEYGHRIPENPSDKLPALANIARAYAEVLQDEYIAGFWKLSILVELCWQSLRRKDLSQSDAPSWSWASFGGIPALWFVNGRESWEPIAKFLAHHAEPQGSDLFGAVKDAWITVEAPLIPLELVEKDEKRGHIFLRTLKGNKTGHYAGLDLIDREYEVSAEQIKKMKVYCLVLGVTHPVPQSPPACLTGGCTPRGFYRCVIVTPAEDGESMKRIGFLLADSESLCQEELDLRAVVTLK